MFNFANFHSLEVAIGKAIKKLIVLLILDRLIFSCNHCSLPKVSFGCAMLGKTSGIFSSMLPITITEKSKSWFKARFSSFTFKIAARKAKICIYFYRILQPMPSLIPHSIKASFFGPKHAYRIRTQRKLLRNIITQIISINWISFAQKQAGLKGGLWGQ